MIAWLKMPSRDFQKKQKIFCSKQTNNFIGEVSKDVFIVQLNSVKDSRAYLIKTKKTNGTRSIAEAATKYHPVFWRQILLDPQNYYLIMTKMIVLLQLKCP